MRAGDAEQQAAPHGRGGREREREESRGDGTEEGRTDTDGLLQGQRNQRRQSNRDGPAQTGKARASQVRSTSRAKLGPINEGGRQSQPPHASPLSQARQARWAGGADKPSHPRATHPMQGRKGADKPSRPAQVRPTSRAKRGTGTSNEEADKPSHPAQLRPARHTEQGGSGGPTTKPSHPRATHPTQEQFAVGPLPHTGYRCGAGRHLPP